MSGWRRVLLRSGPLGNARAARNSRTYPKTTFASFTDPPLAHVGLSESEAQRQGIRARVVRIPMSSVLGAQAIDETRGFMKALIGEDDDRILGFTMIGTNAGDVMAVVHTAILSEL